MKLIEEIVVQPNNEKLMWSIDTSRLAYDAELIVNMGCQVLYIVNGSLSNVFDAGKYIINPKKQRRENNIITLVGVNRGKTFSLVWGVGEIPYRDRDSKTETEIGMNGEYTLQLLQPATLYTTFGKTDVLPKDIADKTRSKLAEILKTQLSQRVENYSYINIQSAQGQISDMIRDAFEKEMFQLGFALESFALREIYFPEEFKNKRIQDIAKGDEYDNRLRKAAEEKLVRRRQREETDTMKEFLKGVNASAAHSEPSADPKCPVCGMICKAGTLFCPKCGKKL